HGPQQCAEDPRPEPAKQHAATPDRRFRGDHPASVVARPPEGYRDYLADHVRTSAYARGRSARMTTGRQFIQPTVTRPARAASVIASTRPPTPSFPYMWPRWVVTVRSARPSRTAIW